MHCPRPYVGQQPQEGVLVDDRYALARARRAFAESDAGSLVTSALVWRLTEDIMFSPAATARPTSSARAWAVSPVIATFIP